MAITIYPITAQFAAEIGDVDLAHPLDADDVAAIKQAFWDYAVVIFPEQNLTQEQHVAFAKYIGPIEPTIGAYRPDSKLRLPPELVDISNLNVRNEIWGEKSRLRGLQLGNRLWHTDSSFKYLPARASLLYARTIAPVGGHTEFADLRAAYDALDDSLKRKLPGLIAIHALAYSRQRTGFSNFSESERKELPPVPQVMVRTIPENGCKSLYIASHIGRIIGMPDDEALALVDQLIAHATQRQFVYTHRWRLHDLVMWDDRCTMHRGTEYDDLRWTRDMHRATVSDIANTCEQEGVAIPGESQHSREQQ
ncbi:MAG: TauD/TfdA family dioxygenase [Candidatus Binatus sp.]|uniref:TauD/TfdA dioxygenase family protein n=1 Tax=Candidatus Binatus sp. TaxID=2811406 RepID=UPI002728D5DA|nr:TauD/TfdA family dioxygenase [Candidatus Binatus sp.]MDO8434098.1 TauD/TfdA family dioxygenase [Candidatus Binatus sp.]